MKMVSAEQMRAGASVERRVTSSSQDRPSDEEIDRGMVSEMNCQPSGLLTCESTDKRSNKRWVAEVFYPQILFASKNHLKCDVCSVLSSV